MPEPRIIANFPDCPVCKSKVTISELATADLKATGKIPKETFTMLRQNVVPLEQPTLAGVMIPCIVTIFDVCAICGTERCTRAQIVMAPVQAPPGPHNYPFRPR